MYQLIRTKDVFFPNAKKHGIHMSENCQDFIEKCLKKDPNERLGSTNGIDEILAHPWFSDIDVDALMKRQIVPDFKPKLSGDVLDVSNFDKSFTSDEAAHSVTPLHLQKKIARNSAAFEGFDA